jgi:hypothetical protein
MVGRRVDIPAAAVAMGIAEARRWGLVGLALAVGAPLLIACVSDRDDRYLEPGIGSEGDDTAPSTSASAGTGDEGGDVDGGIDGGTDGGGSHSLTAIVDTNRTLNATAGQGVGVFVEYDSGGHWDVSWTCDTAISNETCDFDLAFTIVNGGGAVPTNVMVYGDPTLPPVQGGLVITSTVGSSLDEVTFDTAPGATIELTTKLSGELNGAIVFFVQDGAVNGGYAGTLSDPLDFVGATP